MHKLMNPSPVIIAGMHRSGTSWTTSLLAKLGLNPGVKCFPADVNNKKGYFEDINFLALNKKILNSSLTSKENSYIDWGWSATESLDPDRLLEFESEALQLLSSHKDDQTAWGWKDPRNTVLLNFWDKLCPEAKYVLIYRYPWEVADSMQRLGAAVFLNNPVYAWEIWEFYNRQLLDFYYRNRQRCLLISSNALSQQVTELPRLCSKLGFNPELTSCDEDFDPNLFRNLFDPQIALEINAIAFPAVIKLLLELDSVADLGNSWVQPDTSKLRFNHSWKNCDTKPKVSVIIPCFNQGIFLPEALASLESFAPQETEVLVTNDGSTDSATIEILNNFAKAGYTVIDQSNTGLATTRNRMVRLALADIILPLDADNRICQGFIDKGLEKFSGDPQISIVYGDRVDFGLRNQTFITPEFNLSQILQMNYIDACALIRKSVILDCGGYDSNIQALEDWELWIHAAAKGYNFSKLPFSTFEYRVRPLSMVTLMKDPQKLEETISYVQQKHFKLYLPWLNEKVRELHLLNQKVNDLESVYQKSLDLTENQRKLLSAQKIELEHLKAMNTEMSLDKQNNQAIRQAQTQEVDRLNLLLSQIQSSKSWKMTAPLRAVVARVRSKIFSNSNQA